MFAIKNTNCKKSTIFPIGLFKNILLVLTTVFTTSLASSCTVLRPGYDSATNSNSFIDRTSDFETPPNTGYTRLIPFNEACYSMGFWFLIKPDGKTMGARYTLIGYDDPSPIDLILRKATLNQYTLRAQGKNGGVAWVKFLSISFLQTEIWYYVAYIRRGDGSENVRIISSETVGNIENTDFTHSTTIPTGQVLYVADVSATSLVPFALNGMVQGFMFYQQCTGTGDLNLPQISQNFVPRGIYFLLETYAQIFANRIDGPLTLPSLMLGNSISSADNNPGFDPVKKVVKIEETKEQFLKSDSFADSFDSTRAWNYVGFSIEYEPLEQTNNPGDFDYLVEVNTEHALYFVINLEDLSFSLLDKDENIMLNLGITALGTVAKYYCSIGTASDPAITFYTIFCQNLNGDKEYITAKVNKLSFKAGENTQGEFRFYLGTREKPALTSYLMSKFEIYEGGTLFRPGSDCGILPAFTDCDQMTILERDRHFCHTCTESSSTQV
jgi:hypothetical protein